MYLFRGLGFRVSGFKFESGLGFRGSDLGQVLGFGFRLGVGLRYAALGWWGKEVSGLGFWVGGGDSHQHIRESSVTTRFDGIRISV